MNNYTINDLITTIIDYRGKTPKKLGYQWETTVEGCIPAISAKNIKNGRIVKRDHINYGSQELFKKWMKEKIERGNILITSEAPIGEVMYWDIEEDYILSQRVYCLKINEDICYPKYLYSYLRTYLGKKKMMQKKSGTTVFGIRQKELLKINISMPNMKKQKELGDLFYNLELQERKQENFMRIVYSEIEALFDLSLIKSSNDSKYKLLKDVIKIENGIGYNSSDITTESSGHPFISLSNFTNINLFNYDKTKRLRSIINQSKIVKKGDLILNATDITPKKDLVGRSIILPNLVEFNKQKMQYSCDLSKIIVIDDSITKEYLMLLLNNETNNKFIRGYATGTNVIHLNMNGIKNLKYKSPQKNTMNFFTKLIKKYNDLRESHYNLKSEYKLMSQLILNYIESYS